MLKGLIEQAINQRIEIPQWMVTGRTVLIAKSENTKEPGQYRPIACLNTMYKTLTAVVERVVRAHVMMHQILPQEQCALRKGRRGCFDALMIDSMVTEDAMHRHRNLDVAWIDYRKAFDHVPHGWLREMLELCRVPLKIQQCLSDLQTKWRTVFSLKHAGGELTTPEVQYRRGLFQGDALSPLLFCLSVTPLSFGLRNTTGYPARFLTNPATHLMFVDDLKIYASGAKALGQSLKVVKRITTAIGMRIGAQKCATACLRKGSRGI